MRFSNAKSTLADAMAMQADRDLQAALSSSYLSGASAPTQPPIMADLGLTATTSNSNAGRVAIASSPRVRHAGVRRDDAPTAVATSAGPRYAVGQRAMAQTSEGSAVAAENGLPPTKSNPSPLQRVYDTAPMYAAGRSAGARAAEGRAVARTVGLVHSQFHSPRPQSGSVILRRQCAGVPRSFSAQDCTDSSRHTLSGVYGHSKPLRVTGGALCSPRLVQPTASPDSTIQPTLNNFDIVRQELDSTLQTDREFMRLARLRPSGAASDTRGQDLVYEISGEWVPKERFHLEAAAAAFHFQQGIDHEQFSV
jgi:hypothetical protein